MRALADSGASVTAREVVAGLGLRTPRDGRPRVVAAIITSVDGRATVQGRSVRLGHPDDRALLRELRTAADAVLAGSGTLRAERYRALLDDDQIAHRRVLGLTDHPIVATVSRLLTLRAADVPLFAEEGVPVVVYAERAGSIGETAADVDVHDLGPGGVDFPRVLAHLHRDHGVDGVICEGGPTLLRELVAQDCLDDLLITVAPVLAAGDGPAPLSGQALVPPAALRLRAVHRADEHMFLHYVAVR